MSVQKLYTEYRSHTRLETDYSEARADASLKRCIALAAINKAGHSYGRIAAEIGLSRSRVQAMVEKGRQR